MANCSALLPHRLRSMGKTGHLLASLDRQRERHHRPPAHDAVDADLAAVGFDETARDGQTQTAAPGVGRFPEAIEDVRQRLGGDATPGVGHPEERRRALSPDLDPDRAAARRMAQRVVEQVLQHLTHPHRVDIERGSGADARVNVTPASAARGVKA